MCVAAGVIVVVGMTAASAQAAPVSWALSRSADQLQGTTSCRQDDGLTDYPTDLSAEGAGCTWRKGVIIPDWIRARLTGFRAFVQTDVYSGNWTVSGLAPDGTTRLGTAPVSNRAGRSDSGGLDPNAVIGPDGRATLILAGEAYAGTFASLARGGFQVEYDDVEPPRLDPSLALSQTLRSGKATPALEFSLLENGPIVTSVKVDWGDGDKEDLLIASPDSGASWSGSQDTRFNLIGEVSPHVFRRDGTFRPVITATDGAGNVMVHKLGSVTVAPPPVAVRSRPRISGRPVVGSRLRCSRGTWTGQPRLFVYQWQRSRGGRWVRVGASARSRLLTQADAGRRVRCLVKAKRTGRLVSAPSNAVSVKAAR